MKLIVNTNEIDKKNYAVHDILTVINSSLIYLNLDKQPTYNGELTLQYVGAYFVEETISFCCYLFIYTSYFIQSNGTKSLKKRDYLSVSGHVIMRI